MKIQISYFKPVIIIFGLLSMWFPWLVLKIEDGFNNYKGDICRYFFYFDNLAYFLGDYRSLLSELIFVIFILFYVSVLICMMSFRTFKRKYSRFTLINSVISVSEFILLIFLLIYIDSELHYELAKLYYIAFSWWGIGFFYAVITVAFGLAESMILNYSDKKLLLSFDSKNKVEAKMHIERKNLEKLSKLLQISTKIKIEDMTTLLKMKRSELIEKLIEWADKFSYQIDGDYISIQKDEISNFIELLDNKFDSWKYENKK